MRDRDETSSHHLNNADSEVLMLHRVDANLGKCEDLVDLAARQVKLELNTVVDFQLPRQCSELLHYPLIVWTPRGANEPEFGIQRHLSGSESSFPDMQLKRMVFLGPELSEAHHEVLALAVLGWQQKCGVLRIARWVDLRRLIRLSP